MIDRINADIQDLNEGLALIRTERAKVADYAETLKLREAANLGAIERLQALLPVDEETVSHG